MPEATDQPAQHTGPRDRRVYGWWVVGIGLLSSLGLLALWLIPLIHTGIILQKIAMAEISPQEGIERLGGPQAALPRLWRYSRLPASIPNTHVAIGIMGNCGHPAVPFLIETFASGSDRQRMHGVWAFRDIGEDAVPYLIAAMRSADSDTRYCCAHALGEMGPTASEALPALTEALMSTDGSVRDAAATALGKIGPRTTEAVAGLIAAVGDPSSNVRESSVEALGRCPAEFRSTVVPVLVKALSDDSLRVNTEAMISLGRFGSAANSAVPALIKQLDSPFIDKAKEAARALGKIGPSALEAVPALEKALKGGWELSAAAGEALKKIRGEEPPK